MRPLPLAHFIGLLRLGNAALNGIGDQFFMPVAARFALIDLRDEIAVLVIAVGIDAGKSADAAGRSPGAGAFAVGHGNAFAALNERQHFTAGNDKTFKRFHAILSWVNYRRLRPGYSSPFKAP